MKIIISTLSLMLLVISICSAEAYKSCNDNNLKAIKSDFDKSYKQYKLFWDTLNCYGKNAVNGDTSAISAIISLYGIGAYNSEYTEWYAETIETMFLQSPQDLFDVLLIKNNNTVDGIMFYLENPIDGEKEAIIAVAKKIEKKIKYRDLAKRLIDK